MLYLIQIDIATPTVTLSNKLPNKLADAAIAPVKKS